MFFVQLSMCSQLSDTGAALPKVAVAMLKLGVWYFGVGLGHKSICFFLPISCREHQPPTYQQRKAPILSQKSFAPHFVFALDASLHLITMCHHGLPFCCEGTAGNCGSWDYPGSLISCQECSTENAPLLWWVHPPSPALGSSRAKVTLRICPGECPIVRAIYLAR